MGRGNFVSIQERKRNFGCGGGGGGEGLVAVGEGEGEVDEGCGGWVVARKGMGGGERMTKSD